MIQTPTKRGREKSAAAMASEFPTEFLSRRLLIGDARTGWTDHTDRLEACVVRSERREEDEDGSGGQVRPALVLEATLGGRVPDLQGKYATLWRYVDGEPHIGFLGEILEADDSSEETPIQGATPGTWNADMSLGARVSMPGQPASTAAYSLVRRNERYRGARIPYLSQVFARRGSRDYPANHKLAVALEELRRETSLAVLDRADSTALGWVPPALNSKALTPAVWYEVGVHLDARDFRAPRRRSGNWRDAWAYRVDKTGHVAAETRRPMERRGLVPPKGVDFEIALGEEEDEAAKKSGAQRTHDASRLFSYRERDLDFVVHLDPRLERTDVIGLIERTTEGGLSVVRRYAMPVEAFAQDDVANEASYQGFATELSVERAPIPRQRIVVPALPAPVGGVVGPWVGEESGRTYVEERPWAVYVREGGVVRIDAEEAEKQGIELTELEDGMLRIGT